MSYTFDHSPLLIHGINKGKRFVLFLARGPVHAIHALERRVPSALPPCCGSLGALEGVGGVQLTDILTSFTLPRM